MKGTLETPTLAQELYLIEGALRQYVALTSGHVYGGHDYEYKQATAALKAFYRVQKMDLPGLEGPLYKAVPLPGMDDEV